MASHAAPAAAVPGAAHPALSHHFESLGKQTQAQRLGMWLFLATEILLFTVLFAAYGVYRYLYAGAFSEASRGLETWMGGVNTFVLVTSSFTVAMGLDAIVQGKNRRTGLLFGASILMGAAFMVLKAVEYRHHFAHAELPGQFYGGPIAGSGGSLFFTLYFLITGLHGIHVVVGMTVLAVIGIRAGAGGGAVAVIGHRVAPVQIR
jgi:cytochrome c oxidase subunit 3